jgi:modification methylase
MREVEHQMSCPALLYIGNSQRMVEIGDNSIDFIFAGPPYWTHLKYSQDQEQLGNIKHYDIFHAEISKVWSECYRVLKPGSFLCVHTNNLYEHNGKIILKRIPLTEDFTHHIRLKGFVPSVTIFWDSYLAATSKQLPREGRTGSRSQFIVPQRMQYFSFFLKDTGEGLNSEKYGEILARYYWKPYWKTVRSKKLMGSIFLYRVAFCIAEYLPFNAFMKLPGISGFKKAAVSDKQKSNNFPASMDQGIVMKILKDFTDKGDCVLDPFAGSGTTLLAAVNLKLRGVGYEINGKAAEMVKLQLKDKVEVRTQQKHCK